MRTPVALVVLLACVSTASAFDFTTASSCPIDYEHADGAVTDTEVFAPDIGCRVTSPWRSEGSALAASVASCQVVNPDAPGGWVPTEDTEVRYSQTDRGTYLIAFNVSGEIEAWPCE